jgi:uncharacterized membrane protein YoaK (UPF0700 family)
MLQYARFLLGQERTDEANRHLGLTLAFVAGAVNAGGFLAVSQYTSHMTGIVSALADALVLSQFSFAGACLAAFIAFLAGAASTAVLVNWGRRMKLRSQYALPLMLESLMLFLFGLLGTRIHYADNLLHPTVLVLCYTMGLQNAVITKVSNAVIRTTHVTGLTTDLGIELGKLFYWNLNGEGEKVAADRPKMKLHASMLALFAGGGLSGAVAFKRLGFVAVLPLAGLLLLLSLVPIWDDLQS